MTEQQWLTCLDPWLMLAFLRGRVSERKFRLFVCAATELLRPLDDVTVAASL